MDNLKKITIKEISEMSGLTKKEIRKHLIAQTLQNTPASSGYYIKKEDLETWLLNIPKIDCENLQSIFQCSNENQDIKTDIVFVDISKFDYSDDWMKNDLNGIKFADFFCGAGGLSLGLVMAGYEPVLGVEINDFAYTTYINNLGKRFEKLKKFSSMDITINSNKQIIIDYLKNENIKVICGGFPCQGFSLSGSRIISDPRNTLYKDMLDIVKEVKPDYIIMENVLGIKTIFKGKVLQKIISDYQNIGYNISFQEINAADYEVAQTRKRLIFVGNRGNKKNVFPEKIITNPSRYISCGEILEKYKTLTENANFNHIFSKHSLEMQERLMKVEIGKCLYPNYNDSWKKCDKNKPSCTIKGNHGATNIHYELPRVITPREMAALQSFPDNYIFYGNKHALLTQIGNAVPPYVARAVGLALIKEIIK